MTADTEKHNLSMFNIEKNVSKANRYRPRSTKTRNQVRLSFDKKIKSLNNQQS